MSFLRKAFTKVSNKLRAEIPPPITRPFEFLRYFWQRPVRSYLLATVAAGSLLQVTPQAVSTSLDTHMRRQNLPALSQYFSTKNMRVVDRGNPLQVPFVTGFAARVLRDDLAQKPVSTSFGLLGLNFNLAVGFIFANPLDAYAIADENKFDARACLIRPPQLAPLEKYINGFTRFKADKYEFDADNDALRDAFYTYVMAHEARHCDQSGTSDLTILIESDADIYAMRVVSDVFGDTETTRTLPQLLDHIRVISAVVNGDSSHASSRAFARDKQSALDSINDQALYLRLGETLREVVRSNKDLFEDTEETYTDAEKLYHAATALLRSLDLGDRDLRRAAESYVRAVDYLNDHTPDDLIKTLPPMSVLSVTSLTAAYTPAPDRVARPAATSGLRPAV